MIIAVSGRLHSGKTTFSNILVQKYGFQRASIAQRLKEITSEVFNISLDCFLDEKKKQERFSFPLTPTKDQASRLLQILSTSHPIPQTRNAVILQDIMKLSIETPRQLLQRIGTEIVRQHFGEDYWVDCLYKTLNPNTNYVIDDQRFKSEFNFFKKIGAIQVMIIRPYYQEHISNHSSEIDLNRKMFDHVLVGYNYPEFLNTCHNFIHNLFHPYKSDLNPQLLTKYFTQNKSTFDIAEQHKCSRDKVVWACKKFGIHIPLEQYRCNSDIFNDITTPEQAYWLGFLLTDGCIKCTKTKGLEFLQNDNNKQAVYDFAKFCKSKKPIKIKMGTTYKNYSIMINNPYVVEDLKQYGMVNNKTYRDIPITPLPTELEKDYLRGIMDGNGYACKHFLRITNSSYNQMFNNYIVDILHRLGVPTRIRKYKTRNAVDIEVYKASNVLKVYQFCYYKGCQCLLRKQKRFEEMYNNIEKALDLL